MSPLQKKYTEMSIEKGVGVQLILLLLFILLNQVRINLEVLDVEVGMEESDLLFTQVEALAEV